MPPKNELNLDNAPLNSFWLTALRPCIAVNISFFSSCDKTVLFNIKSDKRLIPPPLPLVI
ncbi:hypothetical protein [Clostridium lamae]|uniref:hypothetical protein n=1 Tax=Clostridium TaxID=1485 RepID=UPI00374F51A1